MQSNASFCCNHLNYATNPCTDVLCVRFNLVFRIQMSWKQSAINLLFQIEVFYMQLFYMQTVARTNYTGIVIIIE